MVVGLGASAQVTAQAVDVGGRVVSCDLAARGLDGLLRTIEHEAPSVVHLPALLGRWIEPSPVRSSGVAVRTVVLHGSSLDPASVAGVRGAFGSEVEVVCWSEAQEGPDRSEMDPMGPAASRTDSLPVPQRPGGDLESDLLHLLETVTGREPLALDDPFLSVGGSADRAAWFVDEVGWRFGVRLRAAELIDHPTTADIAALVRRDQGRHVRRPVTATLAAAGDGGPTLFVVHDVGGSPFPYLDLASRVAADWPGRVVGFESPLLNGRRSPFRHLELMAMRYLTDLRRLQPNGPYFLAGWGFGGAVAFEMARQLLAEAAEVELLAVADMGPAARISPSVPPLRRRAAEIVRKPMVLQRTGVVPLIRRPDHARLGHERLLRSYTWPTSRAAPATVALAWSADVGSIDATMGWGALVGSERLRIDRLASSHTDEASADSLAEWATILGGLLR